MRLGRFAADAYEILLTGDGTLRRNAFGQMKSHERLPRPHAFAALAQELESDLRVNPVPGAVAAPSQTDTKLSSFQRINPRHIPIRG
jgi:hypothetical protein